MAAPWGMVPGLSAVAGCIDGWSCNYVLKHSSHLPPSHKPRQYCLQISNITQHHILPTITKIKTVQSCPYFEYISIGG